MRMLTLGFMVLFLLSDAQCIFNNVCPTFQDYFTVDTNPRCWYDVAADHNATTIIVSHGYGVETHKIITKDGYLITLFRIVNFRNHFQRKAPVLLQHGFWYSGAAFVGLGRKSLGLTLADAGYDVWLGNVRGSEYSEGHVFLTRDDVRFWNFNLDDTIFYDVDAQLKYIARVNSENGKIIYIGHSQGSSIGLGYGATFPRKTDDLVKLFIFLGPNGGIENTRAVFLRVLLPFTNLLVKLFANSRFADALSNDGLVDLLMQRICLSGPMLMYTCMWIINAIFMGPQDHIDASIVPIFFNQFPAGTGFRAVKQNTETASVGLRPYDYGEDNLAIYGSYLPHVYDVSKIEVPVFLVNSLGDWCATKQDTERLYSRLTDRARIFGRLEIAVRDFNHNDFVYGRRAKKILYSKLLRLMDSVRYY